MENISEKVKEIKQSFRQIMDGAVAKSMRDKGLEYKLNWGATLPRLREMAENIGQDYSLAIALWKEDVRECKILATLLMPADKMLPEVCDIWMEQISSFGSIFRMPQKRPISGLPVKKSMNSCADIMC